MARTELTTEQHQLARERAELRRQQRENAWQHRLTRIYQQARNKGQILKQCESNENLLGEYAGLPSDLLAEAIKRDADCFSWIDIPASKLDKKAEERDRVTFTAFAKRNRYADNIANFNIAREILGPGNVTEYGLIQAVQTGGLRLSHASSEELEQREVEAQEEHIDKLKMMSAHEIRKLGGDGIEERRRAQAQAEAQRVLEAKKQAEAGTQYPALPEFLPEFLAKRFGNQRLDRNFLQKKADRETFKFLHQKYGHVAVEERLRGIR